MALASILGLCAATACDAWLTTPSQYAHVQVEVRGNSGEPVANAPVLLYTGDRPVAYDTTDASGRFLFVRVPPGDYGVNVTHPFRYRDFVTPDDSPSTFHDGLKVKAGGTDTVRFVMTSCTGTVTALVLDQNQSPVARVSVRGYTQGADLGGGFTDASGKFALPGMPCVRPIGIRIKPPAGYSVAFGSGSSYYDGFSITSGQTRDFVFHVTRQP